MKLPWRRRVTAPVALPTQPGRLVRAYGREYVIRTISHSSGGDLSVELLRRDEWERRYRIQ